MSVNWWWAPLVPCTTTKDTNPKDAVPPAHKDPEVLTQTTCPIDMLKDTNPKDAVGTRKAPMSTIPSIALLAGGLAMLDGACKYGRHNYRAAPIRASIYYDAAMRHLMAWWEGENCAEDSGLHHLGHVIACMAIIMDAELHGTLNDDRPPRMPDGWLAELNARAGDILDKHTDVKDAFTEKARTK